LGLPRYFEECAVARVARTEVERSVNGGIPRYFSALQGERSKM
jgi:hypothetical protein